MVDRSDAPESPHSAPAWRRAAVVALKLVVVALVVAFVSHAVRDGLQELAHRELTVAPVPALAACVAFALAQLVMAVFWRQVLVALRQPAPAGASVAAFFLSQLGKYVPGKASVVLIRTERLIAAVRQRPATEDVSPDEAAVSASTIGASVFYETLTYMAVGSLLSAGLTAIVTRGSADSWWAIGLSIGLAAACLTPTLPPVFGWLLSRVTPAGKRVATKERLRGRLTYGLAAAGAAASCVAWTLMGVSVWLAAESIGATGGRGLAALPLWTLAGTLPAVAGFVSLLPAGVVVREALSLGLLSPALGEANALAVTIAFRLVGVATEVGVCASLLVGGMLRRRANRPPNNDPKRATGE